MADKNSVAIVRETTVDTTPQSKGFSTLGGMATIRTGIVAYTRRHLTGPGTPATKVFLRSLDGRWKGQWTVDAEAAKQIPANRPMTIEESGEGGYLK